MPCSDGNWGREASCSRPHCGSNCKERAERLDWVTRSACDMRTLLRKVGMEHCLTDETRKWIAMHDEQDAQRIAEEEANGIRERTRRQALAKLNLDERRVLGL